ncbi:MAG: ATP-binding cassette domain-containing protein [Rickettsiales bacterium]|nr:ATP-binding cassette domain-containing protein [Rickettsiales bacterium]
MVSPLIHADSLCVTRQGKSILNKVSLHIDERDFITIIGPNGAGKSMLLKCLMGFYAPDSGTITRRDNLKIGYVPQRLFTDHTLPITVERFLRLRKKAHTEILQRTAAETGITDILQKPLHVLSGGELQRTLLARALLDDPQLLVLDEPAQNLDISGQLAFYKLLDRIYRERKLSILMVSHDLHMVMASTRQVVCLFHHICCEGKPEDVGQHPEFINLFGHDMSDMLKVYTHHHSHEHHHA